MADGSPDEIKPSLSVFSSLPDGGDPAPVFTLHKEFLEDNCPQKVSMVLGGKILLTVVRNGCSFKCITLY